MKEKLAGLAAIGYNTVGRGRVIRDKLRGLLVLRSFDGADGGACLYFDIEGFDGVASGDNADGAPLFPAYELEVDLPKEDGVHDFDVPGQ
jgi:hypothetical protein